MKKRNLLAFGMIITSLIGPISGNIMCYAAHDAEGNYNDSSASIEERTEGEVWHYRFYDGKMQKRLWSVTQEKWLTDWIDC